MVSTRFVLIIIILALSSSWTNAQEKRGRVSAIARSGEKEILLRWAPNDPIAWKLGNRYGYTIERFTIGKDGHIDSTGQWTQVLITPQPVKPWPLDDWSDIANQDSYAAIAAQAIYGEAFEVTSPSSDVISFINQVEEEKNRFGFALFAADHSANAAQASGLRWKDATVKTGEEYLYRIAVAANSKSYPIDTALVTAEATASPSLPEPPEVSVHFGDRIATIRWNGFYFKHIYVSYLVEKSENGKHFEQIHDLPVVHADQPDGNSQQVVLTDSLAQNGKTYYYRVRGMTAFAETGPPSSVISGKGVLSLRNVHPMIDTVSVINNQSTLIHWSFPEVRSNDVLGYEVIRSASLNGTYQPIHPGLLTSFNTTYTDQVPLSTNYYRVRAMGPDSVFTSSPPYMITLEDSVPPVLPLRFDGEVNESGRVDLHWSSSPSKDILGYRLFRANNPEEEFVMISSETISDTTYVDRVLVATLTEEVYYRIVAIDRRFNVSDYSPILVLKRPDILPPVPAQFTLVTAAEEGIHLQWTTSPSTDLSACVLLRWHSSSSGYHELQRFTRGDSIYTYLDSLVKPGESYRYILRTIDDAGLNASHPSVSVTALNAKSSDEVKNLQAEVDRDNRRILLRWEQPTKKTVSGYRIFRALGEAPLRYYRHGENEPYFLDQQLQINRQYRYAVQAVFDDGSENKLSPELRVDY